MRGGESPFWDLPLTRPIVGPNCLYQGLSLQQVSLPRGTPVVEILCKSDSWCDTGDCSLFQDTQPRRSCSTAAMPASSFHAVLGFVSVLVASGRVPCLHSSWGVLAWGSPLMDLHTPRCLGLKSFLYIFPTWQCLIR